MDQGVALFPEDELIGLKVELCSGGASVNWMLSVRCLSKVRCKPTLGDPFSCFPPDAGFSTLGAEIILVLLRGLSLDMAPSGSMLS